MITNHDLRIEFLQDCGGNNAGIDQDEYNEWIKEQLLFIRNAFDIDRSTIEFRVRELARLEKLKKKYELRTGH